MSTLHTGRDDADVRQGSHLLPKAQRRSLMAVVAGNFLEWFDWTLYALLTTYLAANFFNTAANSPPLQGLASGTDGSNGVYRYGTTPGYPTSSYRATNYWVDVVFETGP